MDAISPAKGRTHGTFRGLAWEAGSAKQFRDDVTWSGRRFEGDSSGAAHP
jgi:hypothetical protein